MKSFRTACIGLIGSATLCFLTIPAVAMPVGVAKSLVGETSLIEIKGGHGRGHGGFHGNRGRHLGWYKGRHRGWAHSRHRRW